MKPLLLPPFENPLEAFLIRRILIIDADRGEVARLAGILASVRGVTEGTLDDASVRSLRMAKAYIKARRPSIIVIDPAIDRTTTVLNFIASMREAYPNIIWVINRSDTWWRTNEPSLEMHAFGQRLRTYYHRSKTLHEENARTSLLATLALCQNDFVLELLKARANDIQSTLSMSKGQLVKFVSKAVRPVLSLLAKRPIVRTKSRTALVLMAPNKVQRGRYERVIAPTLREHGYKPVMMAETFASRSIPVAGLARVSEASLFVGDLTGLSPDVMIDVTATTMAQLPVIFVARKPKVAAEQLPIMLQNLRVEYYSSNNDLSKRLSAAIAGHANS